MQNEPSVSGWVKVNKQLKEGQQGFMSISRIPAGVYYLYIKFPDQSDQ